MINQWIRISTMLAIHQWESLWIWVHSLPWLVLLSLFFLSYWLWSIPSRYCVESNYYPLINLFRGKSVEEFEKSMYFNSFIRFYLENFLEINTSAYVNLNFVRNYEFISFLCSLIFQTKWTFSARFYPYFWFASLLFFHLPMEYFFIPTKTNSKKHP